MRRVLAAAMAWCLLTPATADVVPNGLFSDHVVLQRCRSLPVWGQAEPGEKVTVSLAGRTAETTAGEQGRWMVRLAPLPAGGPHTLTIAGRNTVTVNDVLIGEVWICSGQSNMAMVVRSCGDVTEVLAKSADPQLRLVTVPRAAAIEPKETLPLAWSEAGPDRVANFSAVGYFFGAKLRRELGVPVGLIDTSYGGTPAEAWTEYGALFINPALRPITAGFENALGAYPAAFVKYQNEVLPKWRDDVAKAKAESKQPPRQPGAPMGPTHYHRPAGLYNAMIAPLLPFAIQGAIWYQGESNAGRAAQYRTLFPEMIRNWRKVWGQGDFPFLFVQLAPFMKIRTEPAESSWAELREAQLHTLRTVPNTSMAVITDVGEENDIHPKRKQPVGERLADGALRLAYGRQSEYLGPVYQGFTRDDGKLRISFTHTGGGLVAKDGPLTGFTIAGEDKVFHNAYARISGDQVVVSNPEVRWPTAVRYGWADFPVVNLWNRAGYPATPFRTDDWPRTR